MFLFGSRFCGVLYPLDALIEEPPLAVAKLNGFGAAGAYGLEKDWVRQFVSFMSGIRFLFLGAIIFSLLLSELYQR